MERALPCPSGAHDLGGTEAGTIDRSEKALTIGEKRVDALVVCLTRPPRQIFTMDEHRYAIERLQPEVLQTVSYYEKWLFGLYTLLLEKGVLAESEIEERIEALRRDDEERTT